MVFMGRGFTSGGQESGSVFSAAVCKIQASKHYIKSCPLVPKEKRSCFSESERSALCTAALVLIVRLLSGSRTPNWHLVTIYRDLQNVVKVGEHQYWLVQCTSLFVWVWDFLNYVCSWHFPFLGRFGTTRLVTLLQKHVLVQEIWLGSPFSSWEGGVWVQDKLEADKLWIINLPPVETVHHEEKTLTEEDLEKEVSDCPLCSSQVVYTAVNYQAYGN